MYNITKTTRFGEKGQEINFYVDEEVNYTECFINLPKKFDGRINYEHYNGELIRDPTPIIQIIKFSNGLLKKIYEAHKVYIGILKEGGVNSLEASQKQFVSYSNYSIGLQTFIYLINKLLLLFVFSVEEKYDNKSNYQYIKNIHDFITRKNEEHISEIYSKLIKSDNSLQFFVLISTLNMIYQSQNMFSASNTVGSIYPSIIAIEPSNNEEYKYIFHNHSLIQLITAVNNFIDEVDFYV